MSYFSGGDTRVQVVNKLIRFHRDLYEAVDSNDIKTVCKMLSDMLESYSEILQSPSMQDSIEFLLLRVTNCEKEVTDLFLRFLKIGEIKKKNHNLERQLKVAILMGDLQKAEFLLKNGAKLEGSKWDGESPGIYALCRWNLKNRKDMLKLLIEYGLNIGLKNRWCANLLSIFTYDFVMKDDSDAVEITKTLLDSGVLSRVEEKEEFSSLLRFSVSTENTDLIKFYIDKGVDLNQVSTFGDYPLFYAVDQNKVNIVDFLISNGASVDIKTKHGETALHRACSIHSEPIIKLLLRKGADINACIHFQPHFSSPLTFLDREMQNYEECKIILIKEIAKLAFEKLPVDAVNMELIRKPENFEHFQKCNDELEQLAKTKLYESYSYKTMLKKTFNIKKFAKLIRNKELIKKFEENLRGLLYYENDLQIVLDEAFQERERHETVILRLNSVFCEFLPDLVIRKLAENLTVQDLPV